MKIGGYEIEAELGRGGMGTVFRARSADGRLVALKLLTRTAPQQVARFERERRLLGTFTAREGFVPLLDAGVAPEGPFLVMPLVAGGTLRARLESGPLSVAETISLGETLAEALGRAHARGIVHRDLKPENVLFDLGGVEPGSPGRPLLVDLGIAKHFDLGARGASQSVALSAAGALLGTAGYMAPEQMEDSSQAGPAADVFALGAILHECLAGAPAFEGANILDVFARVSAGAPPLALARPDVPAWLARLIARSLSHDPALRPPDGAALARALRARGGARPGLVVLGLLLVAGGLGGAALAIGPVSAWRAQRATTTPAAPVGSAGTAPVPSREELPGARDARRAAALFESAKAKAAAKDLDGAIADCSKAIDIDPEDANLWGQRAEWKITKNDLKGAIPDYGRALELDPKNPLSWSNRATAKLTLGDFAGAESDAGESIRIGSTLPEAWLVRAVSRQKLGDREGAIADYEYYLRVSPSSPQAKTLRGQIAALKAQRPK